VNLAVDIGNTRTKAAVFQGHAILKTFVIENINFNEEIENIISTHQIEYLVMSSVADIETKQLKNIQKLVTLFTVSAEAKLPFENLYGTPKTLGIDRVALVAAASTLFPNQNCLVIDAGTCITYDFLTSDNEYLGGAIAPGLEMRYKSLHTFTAKLPKLSIKVPDNSTGKSTDESIHSGVVFGIIHEIEGVINQYRQNYSDLTVVLTGGDSNFLSKQLKSGIFANQNFLVVGLNEILILNHNL
jgi:type III pantothenate kinase